MCEGGDKADSLTGKMKLILDRQHRLSWKEPAQPFYATAEKGQVPMAGSPEGLGFQLDCGEEAA